MRNLRECVFARHVGDDLESELLAFEAVREERMDSVVGESLVSVVLQHYPPIIHSNIPIIINSISPNKQVNAITSNKDHHFTVSISQALTMNKDDFQLLIQKVLTKTKDSLFF